MTENTHPTVADESAQPSAHLSCASNTQRIDVSIPHEGVGIDLTAG